MAFQTINNIYILCDYINKTSAGFYSFSNNNYTQQVHWGAHTRRAQPTVSNTNNNICTLCYMVPVHATWGPTERDPLQDEVLGSILRDASYRLSSSSTVLPSSKYFATWINKQHNLVVFAWCLSLFPHLMSSMTACTPAVLCTLYNTLSRLYKNIFF